jgi:hypothetical protein
VPCLGQKRNAHTVWVQKPEGKMSLGRFGIERNKILEPIFKKQVGRASTGLIWLSQETV